MLGWPASDNGDAMARLVRRAVRKLLAGTRWGRARRSRDPFFATQKLIRSRAPLIFDVGAHVGETAARYRALFPDALIHSFEPFPASFESLAATFGADSRVVPHNVAVAETTGAATLRVNRASVTNSLLESDRRGDDYWGKNLLDTEGEIAVKTLALDDFCREQRIERVDVLKIDVQGAEYAVLAGARELLARRAVDLIYLEMIIAPSYVGQRKYHYYLTLLDGLGYELFDLFNLGRRDGRLIQIDGIFVTREILERYETDKRLLSRNQR
jgi:FkbM family methyltransferase